MALVQMLLERRICLLVSLVYFGVVVKDVAFIA